MKKITITLISAIAAITIFAQSPQAFKYQAVVRDDAGDILVDSNVSFRISIRDDIFPSGTILYQETFNETTDDFGSVSLKIGGGSLVSGDFSAIDWSNGEKFMEIELDLTGEGISFSSVGTSQMLSVPFALYAESAGSGTGSNWTENGQ